MKISKFDIAIVEIPMRVSVEHALAERKTARNILVAAIDDEGNTGWGESCPRPYVTGETIESAWDVLHAEILPKMLGVDCEDLKNAVGMLTAMLDSLPRNRQAAFCAAELAVLDLVARRCGESAGDVLGSVRRDHVHYSGVIAANSEASVQKYAAFLKKLGVKQVKVKVGTSLETNLRFLSIVRQILGDETELRIDANCAWDAREAVRQLEAMAPYRLTGVEQPVPGEDLEAMRAVTSTGLVPVVADESLATLGDARRLVEERACNIFNIRISKCGGLINSGRIHRIGRDAGLACQLGAQVGESGILSAAGRHYATRCDDVIWCEGSYDAMLLEASITEPDITIGPGGRASALKGPGLGVSPTNEGLAEFVTDRIAVG